LLVTRATGLQFDLVSSEELTDAISMSVLDAMMLSKELISLPYGGDLPHLHALLEVLQSLGRDQLLATTLMYSAL
jgi:hypothetical protein